MRRIYTFIAVLAIAVSATANTRSPKNEVARNLDIFNALYKALQTSYVDTIDATASINTAIYSMLADIDPYTEYYPEDDQEEFTVISTGEYGGIGSNIMQRLNPDRRTPKEPTRVTNPRKGTPSAKAGLLPGDVFLTIDGDTVTSLMSSKVSEKLKGQPGTTVHITVKRPYAQDSILSFDVVREKISINPVPYFGMMQNGTTGYINLETFNEKSAPAVRDALVELKKQGAKELILDLRGNPGGILEGAVQIAGFFLPKGTEVVRTRGRGLVNEKTYKTTERPIDTEIPLVVLTDASTASSSEILSGALQDLDRAVVIGERSFGKGLVQSSRPLPYNGLLKVTIARYYTPSGRCVQAIDYSHRNPDGSVSRVPDSLTNVFHTAKGRVVRDGGGITPDITIKRPEMSRLVFNIVNGLWDLDYAIKYHAGHPTVLPPDQFEITDSIYEDFKTFINPDEFKYDRVCEMIIDELEKAAEVEGYQNEQVKETIKSLRSQLRHDLSHDLDIHREEIATYLAREIMNNYYHDEGRIQQSLRFDKDIEKALEILSDPAAYKAILTPPLD
ncbi:MAG: S41 family peptidase [Muribaculaceae bacterium]|nr:S41 family peptidase [Muribaculaceae bacterium]